MNYHIYKASQRGTGDFGWLRPAYYFSFSSYYNPARMGFGAIRVMNDDWIQAGAGFPTHAHDNMEIITIPLKGAVAHRDSTGGEGVITTGEVQVMTAGTGIQHSEFNASKTEHLQLFQIWILPDKQGHKPGYWQHKYTAGENKFETIVDGFDANSGKYINQRAAISRGNFDNVEITYNAKGKNTGLFLVVINGHVEVDGQKLGDRDFMEIVGELPKMKSVGKADILLIETIM
jgi:redox-sensitive bicupin YhaK (pirin superfamily)